MNCRFVKVSFITATLLLFSTIVESQALVEPVIIQPTLSELNQRSAGTWGLSVTEWHRAQELRTIRRGLISADVTPLEVLGIFAESESERKRYAKLYATRQLNVLDRIALFEADYIEAVRELTQKSQVTSDRYRLVTSVACTTARCDDELQQALQLVEVHGLDIYLTDTGGNNTVARNWAARNDIPLDLVRSRQITLNHAHAGMKLGLYQ